MLEIQAMTPFGYTLKKGKIQKNNHIKTTQNAYQKSQQNKCTAAVRYSLQWRQFNNGPKFHQTS